MSNDQADLDFTSGVFADQLGRTLTAAGSSPRVGDQVREVLAAAVTSDRMRSGLLWRQDGDRLLTRLVRLLSHAPFFGPMLLRHPEWTFDLGFDDLAVPRSVDDYRTRLTEHVQQPDGDGLRRFKYFELARITLRELDGDLIQDADERQILTEISALADVLLQASLALAEQRVRQRFALSPTERPVPGFTVLGMGKLGAGELNYSSDVDLVYVFESTADSETLALDGPNELSPVEYYTHVAQEFGRIVTSQAAEGFLYRIDLELRPEGTQAPIVIADTAFVPYYDTWAATWERAAAMKARPVAGDLKFGWRLIRALAPMLYRSSVDYDSVAAITDLKSRSQAARAGATPGFDIKHGDGGIRDVETIAQALQLLYGGRIPQIRQRATEAALEALADATVLNRSDADALLASYRFLRRLEHRVQMWAERQTHSLPTGVPQLAGIAHSLGIARDRSEAEAAAALDQRLNQHRDAVRSLMHRLFPEDTSERIVDFFSSRVPNLMANPSTREAMERLADHFAREIEGGPNPQRALNNLERFIAAIGHRRFYYELLLDRSELVPRLATLFATSEHLSGYLATYPRLIEPIFADPSVLLLTPAQLEENFEALKAQLTSEHGGDDVESALDCLRLFHHRELVNVGLLDLVEKVDRVQAETALTDIAEVCLERGLELAHRQLKSRQAPRTGAMFLVVGMGKLASRELTYGSDLDVIFLYDVPGADEYELGEAQDYFVRLAQKLIWALCTRTATGLCYEVDARLRPSGNQGPLVTSLSAFAAYHRSSAQVWERQALLRARPVAGDAELGRHFAEAREEIVRAALPDNLAAEIHRVRVRMEGELARETSQRHDFKTGHGGLLDVETIVQLLQLQHLREHPQLIEVRPVADQLRRLDQLGLLDSAEADRLITGWDFLQRLSSRLRIVENRSISDLDEERGDLDALARALGYSSPQRKGGARRALLQDYRNHTSAIREAYRRIVEGA